MKNCFNLVDEAWIPVADRGLVSLKTLFSTAEIKALGGNPVQKIALTRLLLAIAQAAATPADDSDWQRQGWQGMASQCLHYLTRWHAKFYLYGEAPFLQMPTISQADIKSVTILFPEVSTGNTTLLTQTQRQQPVSDAEKALALIVQMSFALGGKKTNNKIVLTPGYQGKLNEKGKVASGKPGVGMARGGLLHSFWLSDTLLRTLWINLFTQQDIAACPMYPTLGTPPWEQMPLGEDDKIAKAMQQTLIGRLLPLNKFCLLTDQGVQYTDGILHDNYDKGKVDLSVSVDNSQKKPKVLWVNPEHRPWRDLTSLLQFFQQNKQAGFVTAQLQRPYPRIGKHCDQVTLWSGGLSVTSNAGDQYATGTDDYLQSEITLATSSFGEFWLENLHTEMTQLEKFQKIVWKTVVGYYLYLSDPKKTNSGKPSPSITNRAKRAISLFWQYCERQAQALVDACDQTVEAQQQRQQLRRIFADYVRDVFNQTCPNRSARQMEAWALYRPNLSEFR